MTRHAMVSMMTSLPGGGNSPIGPFRPGGVARGRFGYSHRAARDLGSGPLPQSLKLRRDPTSAAAARRFVHRALEDSRWGEQDDVVVLLANELVTNAILHADSDIAVVIDVRDDRVRVEVRDDAPGVPVRRSMAPTASGGRGLDLVEALASAWGVERVPGDGKAVWFEVRS